MITMSNYHYKNTVKAMMKDLSETAKFMTDMNAFFTREWRNGKGVDKSVTEYVGERQVKEVVNAFGKMTTVLQMLEGRMEQIERMQQKQSIDVVRAKNKRTKYNAVPEKNNEAIKSNIVIMYNRADYMRGKHIGWATPGFIPRDIAFNEFDIARKNAEENPDDPTMQFNVFNQLHIKERWNTLYQNCSKITGMSVSKLVQAYAHARGLKR